MPRRHATLTTGIGDLLVVADDGGLAGLYFPGHWHPPAPESLGVVVDAADDPLFRRLGVELDEYLAGRRIRFDLPLAPTGDGFQHAVWGMLREIPFGETVTYGELADRLGDRNLARRVGGAVGRNPISIIVPCHRVVGADGSLTGYAGGLERKRRLLELEGAEVVAQRRLF
ncbi:methylated-DNA--[protein]-cysteine S-methyltransferase [Agromyces binzhouensis]|uniref:Methylated-DNA--protein-cysteine methyltransferase n=1 Tax=Agromyces binzhouensis TaxID=1817495 RepID=A0A4Q2JQ70_9MICO|nr:methylated-DNA--[protein]-cysteine S-methyltransferase [Agromyces binzhouensis]RXZ48477.1 methylated-DNA--[protein]-cysteine S-methyltransferase [Agromyces binzhouensis]